MMPSYYRLALLVHRYIRPIESTVFKRSYSLEIIESLSFLSVIKQFLNKMELNDSFLLDFCINADFLDNTIDYTATLDQIESSQGENKEIVPTLNTVGQEIVKDIDNNKTNKSENDTVKLDKRFKIIKDEEHKKILDNSILVALCKHTLYFLCNGLLQNLKN